MTQEEETAVPEMGEPAGAEAMGEDVPAGGEAAPDDGAAEGADADVPREGGGALRLLAAAVTLPWAIGYGLTGAWAMTLGARSFADGLKTIDAGYTRTVTPTALMYVGALLLAGFAVMLAGALLILYARRSAMVWLPLLFVAAGLTAGSVWISVRGGLHPVLWFLFFFGLAYVVVVALVRVLQVTRAARRGRIAGP